jgi:hypothetical protein
VRYRIEGDPVALIVCHCTQCQRQSGSAFGMSLVVPKQAFVLESGTPRAFTRKADSGGSVACHFCPDCGTRIYHAPERMAETVNVKPGTLDDTSELAPRAHVWTSCKQPWVPIPEGVRCFEGQP